MAYQTDLRGHLRSHGWSVGLVIVAVLAGVTLDPMLARDDLPWAWMVAPLAIGLVLLLWLRLMPGLVACALMALGLAGIVLAPVVAHTSIGRLGGFGLSVTTSARFETSLLVQPLTYALLLVVASWLVWRDLPGRSVAARLLLSRVTATAGPAQRWELLLLPVALACAGLVGSNAWQVLAIAGGAASILVIARWPAVAARLATAGLILLGTQGFVKARFLSTDSVWPPFHAVITLTPHRLAYLIAAQAVVVLGLGCWLVPQTFPEVRRLLGFATAAELTRKVESLTESRAVAVDTAAANLRRLERDLHDGAQARLVALGMSLRAAERLIQTNPPAALALVAEAREASARALTELRELVRGVHPPVLADRGLADAVRALALDSPLSVQTDIDLPGRPPAPVETACYFAVAEILTNAAKHSGSHAASIAISHADGRLRIVVTDFGLGGADPARGSGLAGVEKRLATFDGIMAVSSPAGGPTIVALEVPCALSSPKISSC